MSITPKQQINIKLDLTQGWMNNRAISLKQADNETRFLVIRLTNLLPLNIVGYQPVVFVKRNDGQILKGLGQVLNAEEGEFVFKLSSNHLAVNGSTIFEVVLTKDETKIMSFPHFTLNVVDSLHDEDVFAPSEDDLSILWEVIGRMQTVLDELDGKFEQFEQEKELEFQARETDRQNIFLQSENARQSAFAQSETQRTNTFAQSEASRQDAFTQTENTRQQGETERQLAEMNRQQAEIERTEAFSAMEEKVDKVYNSTITLLYDVVE